MDDAAVTQWFDAELAALPGVRAVTPGGSRASGTGHRASDGDFAIYYRRSFDPSALRNKGWHGEVSEIGGWGGGVMNGGGWLTAGERRVDVIGSGRGHGDGSSRARRLSSVHRSPTWRSSSASDEELSTTRSAMASRWSLLT